MSEDIGQILAGRTEKRQIGSRAGNSFSVTSFAATGAGRQAGADAGEDYWQNLMPSAVAAHEAAAAAAAAPQALAPRRRRVVDYSDKVGWAGSLATQGWIALGGASALWQVLSLQSWERLVCGVRGGCRRCRA